MSSISDMDEEYIRRLNNYIESENLFYKTQYAADRIKIREYRETRQERDDTILELLLENAALRQELFHRRNSRKVYRGRPVRGVSASHARMLKDMSDKVRDATVCAARMREEVAQGQKMWRWGQSRFYQSEACVHGRVEKAIKNLINTLGLTDEQLAKLEAL